MSTETKQEARDPSGRVLLGAASAALLGGLGAVLVGGLAAGGAGALGALVGAGIAVVVFALGAFVVHVVAGVLPALSLLVALMTYLLQLVLLAVVFAALAASGTLDAELERTWVAVGVITATLVWLVAQVWLVTRVRIPVYDLPRPTVPDLGEASEG